MSYAEINLLTNGVEFWVLCHDRRLCRKIEKTLNIKCLDVSRVSISFAEAEKLLPVLTRPRYVRKLRRVLRFLRCGGGRIPLEPIDRKGCKLQKGDVVSWRAPRRIKSLLDSVFYGEFLGVTPAGRAVVRDLGWSWLISDPKGPIRVFNQPQKDAYGCTVGIHLDELLREEEAIEDIIRRIEMRNKISRGLRNLETRSGSMTRYCRRGRATEDNPFADVGLIPNDSGG